MAATGKADTPGAGFAIAPPVEPMLAKLAEAIPQDGPFLFEPKWDGFRALVFRGDADVYIPVSYTHLTLPTKRIV